MNDVQTYINQQPFSRFQWSIWAMCFAVVLLDGFDTGAIGFIAPSLQGEWGISKPALAPVLSAALFGLAGGALFAGPLADRLGRRTPLIVSVFIFGAGSVGSAFAADLTQLTVLRFITGVGLGAALPNAVTLMSEFSQDRWRATMTNLMTCGFPLGAALGGFLAAWLIPQFGWRSVLLVGGVAPVLLMLVLLTNLPESIRFLASKGSSPEIIRSTLAKIFPNSPSDEVFLGSISTPAEAKRSGVLVILSRKYILVTLMLWIAAFMGLVIFYGLINWMPVLLKDAGLTPQRATLISTLFPLGGVGAVFCGMLMDRFSPARIVASCYGLAAVSVYCIGQTASNTTLLMVVVFAAGVLLNTSQVSMNALAASSYPTQGRATGVAWMVSISRFGGIAGSFLIAQLTSLNFTFADVFVILAVPGAIACIALLISQAARSPSAVGNFGTHEPSAH